MLRTLLRGIVPSRRAPAQLAEAIKLIDSDRLEEAEAVVRRVCVARPNDAGSHHLLGHVLTRKGDLRGAIATLEQASRIAPADANVYYSLGSACAAAGDHAAAVGAFAKAAKIAPEWSVAWSSLADAHAARDAVDEAEDAYQCALNRSPDRAEAHYNYANLLLRLGRTEEAVQRYRRAITLDPDFRAAHTNLVYALNFLDPYPPEAVFREHVAWAARHANALTAGTVPHLARRRDGPLRVGYVSPNFRRHAVTYFFEPILRHHDAARVTVYCYADVSKPDIRTERLRTYAAQWRDIAGKSDEDVAAAVRDDEIDILVDLTGHTENDRLLLFARKPAPVQVTWNGYANTTGLSAIDYRITDGFCDPPGMTEHFHVERLLRMPRIYMPFEPPEHDIAAGPPPCLTTKRVTFASFNALSKVNARTVRLWSRILLTVPHSRLMLLTVPAGRTRTRLCDEFSAHGIDAERLEFRPRLDERAFLEAYRDADIALDTFPFHGTTTTAHTLWMGLPVVTLAGTVHAARVGVSMLSNAGLSHLVTSTEDEYVARAVDLARDPGELATLRASLRERMRSAPNMDGAAFTRALENEYARIWEMRWANG